MIFPYICHPDGELAQLARALAWHARGHRFDSGILHKLSPRIFAEAFLFPPLILFSRY